MKINQKTHNNKIKMGSSTARCPSFRALCVFQNANAAESRVLRLNTKYFIKSVGLLTVKLCSTKNLMK